MNPADVSAVGIPDVDNVEALSAMLSNKNPLLASYISFSSSNLVSQEFLGDALPNSTKRDSPSVSLNQNGSFEDSASSIDSSELSFEQAGNPQPNPATTAPVRIITVEKRHKDDHHRASAIVVASTITEEAVCGSKRSYLANFLSDDATNAKRTRTA